MPSEAQRQYITQINSIFPALLPSRAVDTASCLMSLCTHRRPAPGPSLSPSGWHQPPNCVPQSMGGWWRERSPVEGKSSNACRRLQSMEQEQLRVAPWGRGLLWAPASSSRLLWEADRSTAGGGLLNWWEEQAQLALDTHSPKILEAEEGLDSPLIDSRLPELRFWHVHLYNLVANWQLPMHAYCSQGANEESTASWTMMLSVADMPWKRRTLWVLSPSAFRLRTLILCWRPALEEKSLVCRLGLCT